MSDPITDAITAAVATLPAEDTVTSDPVESPVVEGPPEGTAQDSSVEAKPSEADPDEETELSGIEQELVEKTPGLKQGRIAVSRHQAVVTRIRRKAEAEAAALAEKYKPYESEEWRTKQRILDIAEREPDKFMQLLVADPRYKERFDKQIEQAVSQRLPKPPAAEPVPMPQADVLLPDGNPGYSAEAAQKLLDWRLAQERDATGKQIAELKAMLDPIREDREIRQAIAAADQRVTGMLTDARTNWPGFAEHELAIKAELGKPGNEAMTLPQGYIRVVPAALRADEQKLRASIRADLVKEMSAKRGTRVAAPGGATPEVVTDPHAGPRDTGDVIKDAMAAAGI